MPRHPRAGRRALPLFEMMHEALRPMKAAKVQFVSRVLMVAVVVALDNGRHGVQGLSLIHI